MALHLQYDQFHLVHILQDLLFCTQNLNKAKEEFPSKDNKSSKMFVQMSSLALFLVDVAEDLFSTHS